MAKQLTAPGCKYSIVARVDTTIYSPDQTWTLDVPAGQTDFIAETNEIIIPGDAMMVRKSELLDKDLERVNVLGKGSGSLATFVTRAVEQIVGKGKVRVEYGDGKFIAHTDRVDAGQFAAVTGILERFVPKNVEVLQFNHNMEISWRDINKYVECTTLREMEAVNPDFMNDVTSEGEWIYPLPEMVDMSGETYHANDGLAYYSPVWQSDTLKKWSVDLPKVQAIGYCWGYAKKLAEMNAKMPMLPAIATGRKAVVHFNPTSLKKFSSDWSHIIVFYQPFHEDYSLEEVDLELSSLYGADLGFSATKLNKASSVRILNSLPDSDYCDYIETVYSSTKVPRGYRQTLSLGIHSDHQNDEELWTVIHDAEARGWKLTIKWNPGGPTYTTPATSTMAMGTLIYAKVGEHELPDGTTEQRLDWGHYVTNWEERGYEQFRSLESAYKYFNLELPENE